MIHDRFEEMDTVIIIIPGLDLTMVCFILDIGTHAVRRHKRLSYF